jgi:dnd system-associated protein 4
MSDSVNQRDLFSSSHTIRWSDRYRPVVQFLMNGLQEGQNQDSLFKLYVDVVCFAAGIGLMIGERQPLSGEKLQQIELVTFHNNSLSIWILLIGLLSSSEPNIELLRDENTESEAVIIFEEYACAGLAYLQDKFNSETIETPYFFVKGILSELNVNKVDGVLPPTVGIELF